MILRHLWTHLSYFIHSRLKISNALFQMEDMVFCRLLIDLSRTYLNPIEYYRDYIVSGYVASCSCAFWRKLIFCSRYLASKHKRTAAQSQRTQQLQHTRINAVAVVVVSSSSLDNCYTRIIGMDMRRPKRATAAR